MIDEEATFEKFGYYSTDWKPKSAKLVVAVCDGCGAIRYPRKDGYRDLCPSCTVKKRFESSDARENQSIALKKYFDDPEARKRQSDIQKIAHNTPESKQRCSVAQKKRFEDPEERKRNVEAQKKAKGTIEARKKQSVATKKYFETHPEAGTEHSERLKKLHASDPTMAERHSAMMQGIPHDDWEGFSTAKMYCDKFDDDCKNNNRTKYDNICFLCGRPESENISKNGKHKLLSVHHYDMNKDQGCNGHEWKLVPLCMYCHGNAHSELWQHRIEYLLKHVWGA